jgi:hypothetical protein
MPDLTLRYRNCPNDGARMEKEFISGIPTWTCPICGYQANSMGRKRYVRPNKKPTTYFPQESCNYCGHTWIRRKTKTPTRRPKCGKPHENYLNI